MPSRAVEVLLPKDIPSARLLCPTATLNVLHLFAMDQTLQLLNRVILIG